jgi:nicotinate dehydrogenase subunit A
MANCESSIQIPPLLFYTFCETILDSRVLNSAAVFPSVIMEGKTVRSCSVSVTAAQNREITTLEGLGSVAAPHRLQKAFIDEQAGQCGYCLNGMVMSAKVLLDKNPSPTSTEIKQTLNGVLCRCASHLRIIRAIQRAVNADQSAQPIINYR